eukprot:8821771-Alexandrium_andersonii.AAC.1
MGTLPIACWAHDAESRRADARTPRRVPCLDLPIRPGILADASGRAAALAAGGTGGAGHRPGLSRG